MIIIMAIFRAYLLESHCDLLMEKCLNLMKASNCDLNGKLIGTILWNVYGIKLAIDVGTELGSLDGSLDGSNDVNIEDLLLEFSLGYTDGKLLGNDDVIKAGYTDGKVLGTIL